MSNRLLPLIVDLDGTLIKTDLLIESFIALIKRNPFYGFFALIWLSRGKAVLKQEVAQRVDLDVTVLPYNKELLAYVRRQKEQGRTIALATASHQKYARQIADYLGLFDRIFATDGRVNLASANKAKQLSEAYGNKHFVYAGNAYPDLSVWAVSAAAIVVGPSKKLLIQAEQSSDIEKYFPVPRPGLRCYLKACRVHQWVKNTLIFVPALAAHQILEVATLTNATLAFLAFSLCASSVYLLNDLLDLDADRHHQSKRERPFAAGDIPAMHGVALIPLLLLCTATLCFFLPIGFTLTLLIYYVATIAYSFKLKQQVMLDVIVLAGLYTLRLLAGSTATGIALSFWLMAFSMFIFLSLAMVKRYAELKGLKSLGDKSLAKGRGYEVDDIELLSSLGGASGYISVLVLALYINSESVQSLYGHSIALWAVCPLLLYWISRVWIIAHRGNMHEDPIVFAFTDSISRWTIFLIGAVLLAAA